MPVELRTVLEDHPMTSRLIMCKRAGCRHYTLKTELRDFCPHHAPCTEDGCATTAAPGSGYASRLCWKHGGGYRCEHGRKPTECKTCSPERPKRRKRTVDLPAPPPPPATEQALGIFGSHVLQDLTETQIERLLQMHASKQLPSNGGSLGWLGYPWGEPGFIVKPPRPTARAAAEEPAKVQPSFAQYGKWLLFYPNGVRDVKWLRACEAFEAGLFPDTYDMKVSSAQIDRRAPHGDKAIVFYCTSTDVDSILAEGQRIVDTLLYDKPAFFKTNEQTRAGTSATGTQRNWSHMVHPSWNAPSAASSGSRGPAPSPSM